MVSNKVTSVGIVKNPSEEKWLEILAKSSCSTFFHTKKWIDILVNSFEDCRDGSALFTLDNGEEVIFPAVEMTYMKSTMTSYFSSYTGVYGGPIFNEHLDSKHIQGMFDLMFKLNTAGIYISLSPFIKLDLPKKFNKLTHFTHILNLNEDFDSIWEKQFSHYQRKKIRRAKKSGVEVIDGGSEKDIKAFYALYQKATERWGDSTTWHRPFEFCKNSIEIGRSNSKFKLAILEGKVIAGAVDHYYGDYMYSAWRAFDYDYRDYFPNNLIIETVIREACEEGIKYYDMGASAGLQGVIEFKESFGAQRTDYDNYRWENPIYKIVSKAKKMLSHA